MSDKESEAPSRGNGSRVYERLLIGILAGAVGLGGGGASYTFSGLTAEVRSMRQELSQVVTDLAILRSGKLEDRLRAVEDRVTRIEAHGRDRDREGK